MRQVIVGNTAIFYYLHRVERSRRLTVIVTPGRVDVSAPADADEQIIEDFVLRRSKWIFTKSEEVRESAEKHHKTQPSRFACGAKIPYRGRMMRLFVNQADTTEIAVSYNNGFFINVPKTRPANDNEIKKALETWMKHQLKIDCDAFVRRYEKKLNLYPKALRVKDQKHLWGSLGKDLIININWHLIFAPKQIAEYVTAHEMCHLKYKNHSPKFWSLLRSVFKATDECKIWLEKNKEVWETGV